MNKTHSILIVSAVFIGLCAVPATADWDPGDPHKMHFPQLPDIGPDGTGMNVRATFTLPPPDPNIPFGKILADDWRCSESGPVLDIHIWGSWLEDRYPIDPSGVPNPGFAGFHLSIHADIPATPTSHSQPGQLLWAMSFLPGTFTVRHYAEAPELFYDPNIDAIIGTDNNVWQYNFLIPEDLAFHQEVGTVYWLDVQAVVNGPELWGWKTSRDHFNDAAVFGDNPAPGIPASEWFPMRYPDDHPFFGQQIDLAFVITPEPGMGLLVLAGAMLVLRRLPGPTRR